MSKHPVPRYLKDVVKAAVAQGWTYDTTKQGHPRLSPPAGLRHVLDAAGNRMLGKVSFEGTGPLVAPITFAKTPSDVAGVRNGQQALRRAGVAL